MDAAIIGSLLDSILHQLFLVERLRVLNNSRDLLFLFSDIWEKIVNQVKVLTADRLYFGDAAELNIIEEVVDDVKVVATDEINFLVGAI